MLRSLTLAAIALLLHACAANPVTGTPEMVLMSEEGEIELGKKLHPRMLAQYGVYADPELQAYVNEIGHRLAAQSERPHLDWHFTIIDDDLVNAFATPGGYVYISRGLLAHLQSEAELAGVLAHEIGHITARHAVSRDRNNKLVNLASIAAQVGTGMQAAGAGAQMAGAALIGGFSREQELEADGLGARYIAAAGYPAQAVVDTIDTLRQGERFEFERARLEDREPRAVHGIFSTHPDNDTRLAEAIESAAPYQSEAQLGDRRDVYLAHIDGLRFGPKNAPGVKRGPWFYIGKFMLKMQLPEDWRVQGEPDRIKVIAPGNEATLQVFTVVPGRTMTPEDVVRRKLKLTNLRDGRETTIAGMRAYTAIGDAYASDYGTRPVRAAAIIDDRARRAYVFAGTGKKDLSRIGADQAFLSTINSVAKMDRSEVDLARPPRLKIVQADEATTMGQLAQTAAITVYPEQQVRLINRLYPSGEPEPGAPLKTVD